MTDAWYTDEANRQKAEELVDQLSHFVNVMSSSRVPAISQALGNEHPTLLGQIAKAVAVGVMIRATRNPDWRPFDPYTVTCARLATGRVRHSDHDERLSCDTVIGAELMAHQHYL